MELSYLMLQRQSYGETKGQLTGDIHVKTPAGKIELNLDNEKAERILAIVSEQLVESAKEVAENITREIIEHKPALEAPDA